MHLRTSARLAAALLFTACPAVDDASTTDSSATDSPSETSATDPGTTEITTEVPEPTTGEPTSDPLCEAACAHLLACKSPLAPDLDACILTCLDRGDPYGADEYPATCRPAATAWWTCLQDLACADAQSEPWGACSLANVDYAVGCGGCTTEFEAAGANCVTILDCAAGPTVFYQCFDVGCTCSLDGAAPYASCPVADTCGGSPEEQRADAEACCGVAFPANMGE